jgi:hypothetical protein
MQNKSDPSTSQKKLSGATTLDKVHQNDESTASAKESYTVQV